MSKKPTPKQNSRVTIRIEKSAKGPTQTALNFRGLLMGEFAPGRNISNLETKEELVTIKKKSDLTAAMRALRPSITLDDVGRVNSEDPDAVMETFDLTFEKMSDFHPDKIVSQVPDLQEMAELRDNLKALRSMMLKQKRFKKLLEEILKNGQLSELKDKLNAMDDSGQN